MKKKSLTGLLACLFLFGTVSAANAVLRTVAGPAASDVDTDLPTLVTLQSFSGGTINDLNLFIDYEANTAGFDVTVTLTHIDTGTSVVIWYDSDSIGAQAFDDVNNTTFDDDASVPFINAPLYRDIPDDDWDDIVPGSYTPAQPLSAFDGEDFVGTWQLSVQTTGCCSNEGDELLGWSITADIEASTVYETNTGEKLYDDFIGTLIAPGKWNGRDFVREVDATKGKLILKVTESDYMIWEENRSIISYSNQIESLAADFQVTSLENINEMAEQGYSEIGTGITGDFYNSLSNSATSRIGDVRVYLCIGTQDQSEELFAWYKIEQFTGAEEWETNWIDGGYLVAPGELSLNTDYTLSLEVSENIFTFTISNPESEETIATQTVTGPTYMGEAFVPEHSILNLVNKDKISKGIQRIFSEVDNVAINDSLFDSFDTAPLDPTKWQNDEFARKITDGKLTLKAVARDGQRDTSVTSVMQNASFVSADLTIDSNSQVGPEERLRYRIDGFFYNDSRGPGSGQEYFGSDGNVWAQVYIDVYSDRIAPRVWVAKEIGENWDSEEELYQHNFSTTINYDTPVTLSINFTGEKFIFTCGNESVEYLVDTEVFPSNFDGTFLRVRSQPSNGAGGTAIGHYDNVYVSTSNLFYPHIATSDPWNSEIGAVNTGTKTVHGQFHFFNDTGAEVGEPLVTSLIPYGRVSIEVDDLPESDDIGYIIFESESENVRGYSKFFVDNTYRVAIPAVSEINSMEIPITHVASNDMWWTGISLVNVTEIDQLVTIMFDNGETKEISLMAGEHAAFTVRSLFGDIPATTAGSAFILHDYGIIGLELFGSQNGSENYLSGILLKDNLSTELFYPHTASDQNWWTGVVALNPSPTDVNTVNLTPYKADGSALTSQQLLLDPGEKYIGTVAGLNLPEATAWFKLEGSLPMTGFELFGTTNGNQLAGYTGVDISGKKGVFQKVEQDGWTGIAFVNTEATETTVTLTARDDATLFAVEATISLGPFEKKVDIVENFFSTPILGQATYITYESDTNVVGFQLNGSSDGMLLDGLPAN